MGIGYLKSQEAFQDKCRSIFHNSYEKSRYK